MDRKPAKNKRAQPSIKWKIFLFLLAFCVLLLVILWLFQTVFLESFYTAIKLNQVSREASTLATLYENGEEDAFAQTIRQRGDLYVELVNSDGSAQKVVSLAHDFGMTMGNDAQRAEIYAQTVENGGALSLRYSEQEYPQLPPREQWNSANPPLQPGREERESVLHAEIVQSPEGGQVLLLIRAMVTPVNATVETLRLQLWLISGIMLVLAVGLALLMAGWMARPLVRLNKTAAQLGKGDYEVTFHGDGYREVAQLSDTLNHAARELGKTEGLRRDLIANVSHDLRTPLTLITGYAEMMRDIPGENTPENMQVIIDEAKRLNSLVVDLLDLSRLQSGTSEMHLERIDLAAEVADIIERFQKFGGPEGYTVHFENKAGGVPVRADLSRLSQVIYNFLINAMLHGGPDKTIVVKQEKREERVVLSVADNGPGIAAEQLPYIWERYYKVDTQHRRAPTGSGLGLSIVKGILEQHPGMKYGVESDVGKGCTFWFSLPVEEE